jgi:hypothetical protein
MEYGKGSLRFDVRGLDDWRPARNFALHQRGEWLLTSFCFPRSVAADIEKTLAQRVVVECRVERIKPSAFARMTRIEPIVPPAPGTFSTMNCFPSVCDMCSLTTRAAKSVVPPAANGTTMVTGRVG